jgi:hypothetical protein
VIGSFIHSESVINQCQEMDNEDKTGDSIGELSYHRSEKELVRLENLFTVKVL